MTDGLPRIIAMLCWYDESPSWLAACVASLKGVADHLVAVDGGYYFFPGAVDRPCSRIEEAEVIMNTAQAAGIGLTMHRPTEPYTDNEVGKRSLALDMVYNVAREEDWIFILDADEVVRYAAPDLKHKLAETECLVASYGLWDTIDAQAFADKHGDNATTYESESKQAIRDLHRAVPGLHYEDAHYVLTTSWPDGQPKYFRGQHGVHAPMVDAYDATDLLVLEHRNRQRTPERTQRAKEFYRRRDSYGIESFHTYGMESVDGTVKPVARQQAPS